MLDKTRYRKLVFALSHVGRHQDVLEMFDGHLRLSDEILAHHRDANISTQRAMVRKEATKSTKVYHPETRSLVAIEESFEKDDDVST